MDLEPRNKIWAKDSDLGIINRVELMKPDARYLLAMSLYGCPFMFAVF